MIQYTVYPLGPCGRLLGACKPLVDGLYLGPCGRLLGACKPLVEGLYLGPCGRLLGACKPLVEGLYLGACIFPTDIGDGLKGVLTG
ncbi:hypothetical protein DERF_010418 [Dermatophagoides farinae]|uniref:Uncharacterized protein n=1 Tax=Dermatophagoides farinae TaxID=6954 RepID=A0A922L2J4_DERFA|nr:hypothetical protein DERF_010418 [Dermatophagoides farinae]